MSLLLEAKRLGLIWAAESMVSHRVQRLTFEISFRIGGIFKQTKGLASFLGVCRGVKSDDE